MLYIIDNFEKSGETSAEDILYHFAVRWLSIEETSHRVLQLRKEIQGAPKRPDTFENLIEIKRVDQNN